MRKLVFVMVTTLICTHPIAALATDAWRPDAAVRANPSQRNITINEDSQWERISRLEGARFDSKNRIMNATACSGYGKGNCDFDQSGIYVHGTLMAPRCENSNSYNCIEGIEFSVSESPFVAASYVENISAPKITPDPKRGLTEGSTISIWRSTASPYAEATDYAAIVSLQVDWNKSKNRFQVDNFVASVVPFRYTTGTFYRTEPPVAAQSMGTFHPSCVWADQGRCGIEQEFQPGTRVKIVLRLEKTVGGWFKGRMEDPNLSIESISKVANRVTIDALPVEVPRFQLMFDRNSMSPELKKLEQKFPGIRNSMGTKADFPIAFTLIDGLKETSKDIASGVSKVWSVGTSIFNTGNKCLDDSTRVMGLVTTNAMVFQGSAPKYKDGFLDYKVGGLHYLPDGKTEALGSYDLIIRTSAARCLYKIKNVPVSATVTVVGEDSSKIATVVTGEVGGWLKLSAKNFTFSTKNIRVKVEPKN